MTERYKPYIRRWPRKPFQFSLRTMLLGVLLVSLLLSWFAVEQRRAERQAEVVAKICEGGGGPAYEYYPSDMVRQFGGRPDDSLLALPPFEWLRSHLGMDFLNRVVTVYFRSTKDTDAMVPHLKDLPDITDLYSGRCETAKGSSRVRDKPLARFVRGPL